MTDGYLKFSHSSLGKPLCKLLGLPIPARLQRAHATSELVASSPVEHILVSTTPDGELASLISKNFSSSALTFSQSADSVLSTDNIVLKDLYFDGLIFDARGITQSKQLEQLYHFFQQHLVRLRNNGKICLIGHAPDVLTEPKAATAQRSLVGFVKSLAKEVGRKGISVNLVYLAETESEKESEKEKNHSAPLVSLLAPLKFLMSYQSAYVNGQVIDVSAKSTIKANLESSVDTAQTSSLETPPVMSNEINKPLLGKVALVTGAAQGIGAAIAKQLSDDGAQVIGLDIKPMKALLEQTMASLNGLSCIADVASVEAGDVINDFIKSHVGAIDIIVHNAGITRDKMLKTMPLSQWQQVLNINLSAIENINEHLLAQQLIHDGGRIICLSSISGIAGNVGQTNYATSKAGVIGLVKSSVKPLAKHGITINAVAPGFIETQMTDKIPFLTRQFGRRMSSLAQGGSPVDVANTVAFLALPSASGLSGNVIRVCGQNILGA